MDKRRIENGAAVLVVVAVFLGSIAVADSLSKTELANTSYSMFSPNK